MTSSILGGGCITSLSRSSSNLLLTSIHLKSNIGRIGFNKRNFRGGVVAAAAMAKSEEEWRAILSPEQFRILRQKGTE